MPTARTSASGSARDLASGQKVFLISPRRYGKSSLVRDVMRNLARQKILTVEVTVASSSSYIGFLESYARALVAADTPVGRLKRWTADLFSAIKPEIRFDADPLGKARFALAFPAVRTARDTARVAAEVFALPGRIAEARKQRLAIALDEFQAITAFDGGSVENALRAAVQEQRQVGYVFSGSEPSLMERMLGPRRPFYKAGPVMRLEKINPDDFAAFIEARFAGSGIRPDEGLGEAIVDLAANDTVINGLETVQASYYLSSLPCKVKALASAIRRHWSIESRLHWVLDVTFNRKDASRIRQGPAPQTSATLRRTAVSILSRDTSLKDTIRGKRYRACLSTDTLERILSSFAQN